MSSSTKDDTQSSYKILSKPSQVIKQTRTIFSIDGASYQLNLVTMSRSFLLVIDNLNPGSIRETSTVGADCKQDESNTMSQDEIIRGFMDSNSSLKGLSLAIGEHSTCLIDSDNSLASATLASRLSKKLNMNRPVYVANNLQLSHDTIDSSGVMAKLYMKIFQFVRANYDGAHYGPPSNFDTTNNGDRPAL